MLSAQAGRYAVGHFNISNLETLKAIFEIAKRLRAPVLIGTSEGERKFIGPRQAVALVRSLREEHSFPIYLNADHSKSLETAREALAAGYDSIHFDGSELPFEENLRQTKQLVEEARAKDAVITVEGELGYLRGGSEILDKPVAITPKDFTKPEEVETFVRETGVDILAVVIGNLHGMVSAQGGNPALDLERLAAIQERVGKTLIVLHGGSGTAPEDMQGAIRAGVSIVHINTEIRVAYTNALRHSIVARPKETTPYKFFPPVIEAMETVIERNIKLFGSAGRL